MAANYQDKGKMQVVYRHFAFIGGESFAAADAAECATEQNKFWEYADLVFKRQAGENKGQFSTANLKKWAADEPALDTTAFNACVDSNRTDAVVRQDTAEGTRRGVTGTPTFFVNGRKYEVSPAQLPALIDSIAR